MNDKNGETIASAVTNLDLHDIARACRTYGVKRYYVITPLQDQVTLVSRIVEHWTNGVGGVYNPKRREALERIRIKADLPATLADIEKEETLLPKTVVTSARPCENSVPYSRFREMLTESKPFLLSFGTAWGLTEDFMAAADYRLEPLEGVGSYNHLSVRSAVSITLDRLVGRG